MGTLGRIWGLIGVVAILTNAIVRLVPIALAAFEERFTVIHWVALGVWLAFMIYSEGYRAFHLGFSPRVVARARHLAAHPRPLFVAIAPLYCMGLVHATKKRLIVSWCVTLGIIALVVLVRQLAQPWRGIIDSGVVLGLAVGVASIIIHTTRREITVAVDTPHTDRT